MTGATMAAEGERPAGGAVTDRTVALRGGAVRFRVLSAGSGPPVVYFHSIHERGGWSPFLAALAKRHAVHAPLHPGVQGSSGVEALDDVLDLALAYDELLDALGLASAHLIGHFFGGMVAAELAALFPRRVGRLVLLSPLGLWRDDTPTVDVLIQPSADLPRLLWSDPDGEAARRWAALPEQDEENVAAQIESIQRRAAIARFVWPIPDRGLSKRLHRVAAPTLVLWGASDRVNPPLYGDLWRQRVSGATLSVTPGGHMLLHEAPEAVALEVETFLLGP